MKHLPDKKRMLSLILALAMVLSAMPGYALSARADSGGSRSAQTRGASGSLTVCGTTVTDDNREDILGDGVFSFDGDHTLTVRGDCSASSSVVSSSIDGLVIDIAEDSNLTVTNSSDAFSLFASTTVTGSGVLTLTGGIAAIYFSSSGTLTLDHLKMNVSTTSASFPAIEGGSSPSLVLNAVTASISGTNRTIFGFTGGVTMTDCQILTPEDAYISDGAILNSDGSYAAEVSIGWPEPAVSYDLYIGGVQVTEDNRYDILDDSVFSFDGDHTLTVAGDFSTEDSPPAIWSGLDGLTIYVAEDSSLYSKNDSGLSLYGDTTVTGPGSLSVSSESGSGIWMGDSKTLTVSNIDISASGRWGISSSSEDAAHLILDGCNASASGTDGALYWHGSITRGDCRLLSPQGGHVQRTDDGYYFVSDSDGNVALSALVGPEQSQPVTEYDLYIDGTQVTSENMDDILGSGVFSFDGNHTLSVHGYYTGYDAPVISSWISDLVIDTETDSSLTSGTNDACIELHADATITGTGALSLFASEQCGIYVLDGAALTIDSANLQVSGAWGIRGSLSGESFAVSDSYVDVSSSYGAIRYFSGGITLSSCVITSDDAYISGDSVYSVSSGGSAAAANVSIEPTVYYDLSIDGVQASSENQSDILGNGVFSYYPANQSLTIHGDYTAQTEDAVLIGSSIDGLNIYVTEDSNLVNNTAPCMQLTADTYISGSGRLSLNTTTYPALYLSYGALTLEHATLEVSGQWGLLGNTGVSLSVQDSSVTATGSQGAVCGFTGGITLDSCYILSPSGGYISGDAICGSDGSEAAEAVIVPGDPPAAYDLYIDGTQVTNENMNDVMGDGVFSFDGGHTLTVRGDYTAQIKNVIESDLSGLVIYVEADSALTGASGWSTLLLRADATITGPGKLTLSGPYRTVRVDYSSTLTLEHADLDISTTSGIYCALDGSSSASLRIVSSEITVYSASGAIRRFNDVTLEDCQILSPAGGYVDGGAVYNSDGSFATEVSIGQYIPPDPVYFDLYIDGTQVTSENMDDILGDGVFSFDGSHTLTVSGSYSTQSGNAIIHSSISGLELAVAQDSVLSSTAMTCLVLSADTTITGPAALTVQAPESASGIFFAGNQLTIQNLDLLTDGLFGIYGASSGQRLTVADSTVYATGVQGAICGFTGGIDLEDCEIILPVGGFVSVDGSIVTSMGNTASEVSIGHPEPVDEYDLFIDGTPVTGLNMDDILDNGVFSFDGGHTLTVSGDYSTQSGNSIIQSQIPDLVIRMASDSTLTSYDGSCLYLTGSTTITGASLTVSAPGYSGIYIDGGTLTVEQTGLHLTGYFGIYGGDSDPALHIVDSVVSINAEGPAITRLYGGLLLEGCQLLEPVDGYFDSGSICGSDGLGASTVIIGLDDPNPGYDLYIDDIRVTDANRDDVLGDGNISFDGDHTLTIAGSYEGYNSFLVSYIDGLTIQVSANTRLEMVSSNPCFTLHGGTTVTGDGQLGLISTSGSGIALEDGAALTIDRMTLSVSGGDCGIQGVSGSESLLITDSELSVSGSPAIAGISGGITLVDCELLTPQDGYISGGSIFDSYGDPASSVTIGQPDPVLTYDLYVGGVQVTENNRENLLNGTCSFDGDHTLTIYASYEGSSSFLVSQLDSLIIQIAEDVSIRTTSGNPCFSLSGDTTISGDGELTLQSDQGSAITVPGGGTLTLSHVTLDVSGEYGIRGQLLASLAVLDSRVTASGPSGAICGFGGGITLEECDVIAPAGAHVGVDAVLSQDGSYAASVTIGQPVPVIPYDLYIGGVQVTSENRTDVLANGVFFFDGDHTLTIHGDYTASGSAQAIRSELSGLVIQVSADSALNAPGSTCLYLTTDTTITGSGTLTLSSSGYYGVIVKNGGTLTIRNATLNVTGKWGIAGNSGNEKLLVDASTVTAAGTSGAICDFGGGISLMSCFVQIPAGATVSTSSILGSDGNRATEVVISQNDVTYPLRIGDVQVRDSNRADILGNGTFSFDGEHTLTVHGDYSAIGSDNAIWSELPGLVINVTSDSTLKAAGNAGISLLSDTTITGSGTLNVSTGNYCAIQVQNGSRLTLSRATVNAAGKWGLSGSSGGEKLIVTTSTVTATGASGAVRSFTGGISLTGCYLILPQGGQIGNSAILTSAGIAATEVSISTHDPSLQNPFVDVPAGAYYYDPVLWAVNHDPQITNGTSPTTFSPDNTCTRAQVVTFLWRAMGCPEPKLTANPFVDVEAGTYFYKAVLWAVEMGITNGTDATHFSPISPCTRGQVVTFLWRAEGEPTPSSNANPFNDVPSSAYFYEPVLWAVEMGITNGTSATTFSPVATCQRSQIVTFLYRDLAG